MKLLLVLQFFNDDSTRAMRLARMIADIEPAFRDDVIFQFCARFDTPQDIDTVNYVAKKFGVECIRTTTRWTGWPAGPNGQAMDALRFAVGRKDIYGVLLIEPDCLPLRHDWLDILIHAWMECVINEKIALGAWRPSGSEFGHLNGNAAFDPRIYDLANMEHVVGPSDAWDCAIADQIHDRWQKTDLIRNLWGFNSVTEETLYGHWIGDAAPVLAHGVKDDYGYEIAKRILKL